MGYQGWSPWRTCKGSVSPIPGVWAWTGARTQAHGSAPGRRRAQLGGTGNFQSNCYGLTLIKLLVCTRKVLSEQTLLLNLSKCVCLRGLDELHLTTMVPRPSIIICISIKDRLFHDNHFALKQPPRVVLELDADKNCFHPRTDFGTIDYWGSNYIYIYAQYNIEHCVLCICTCADRENCTSYQYITLWCIVYMCIWIWFLSTNGWRASTGLSGANDGS